MGFLCHDTVQLNETLLDIWNLLHYTSINKHSVILVDKDAEIC
jgi:hypothetical protein